MDSRDGASKNELFQKRGGISLLIGVSSRSLVALSGRGIRKERGMKMRRTKKDEGFTLIELMIVVAIIGILSTTALPSYTNYTAKAKFSEVVMASAPLKVAISVCAQTGECLGGGNWAATGGGPGPDIWIKDGSGENMILPVPRVDTKVISAAATEIGAGGGTRLTVTFKPKAGASNGIKPTDTLILNMDIQADQTVQFSLSGGCKQRQGGAIC